MQFWKMYLLLIWKYPMFIYIRFCDLVRIQDHWLRSGFEMDL